ncbi:hypothetical protein AC579_1069 [Pseudocercospora musae]|uniref:Uncharacterized protein n=1 Tax=Pseudocercospora musae TaxID=113226 RepID=A0A139H765_9PEZI|nr:hypothetical protein AC579_1069 [Pseudocercospora musae]
MHSDRSNSKAKLEEAGRKRKQALKGLAEALATLPPSTTTSSSSSGPRRPLKETSSSLARTAGVRKPRPKTEDDNEIRPAATRPPSPRPTSARTISSTRQKSTSEPCSEEEEEEEDLTPSSSRLLRRALQKIPPPPPSTSSDHLSSAFAEMCVSSDKQKFERA